MTIGKKHWAIAEGYIPPDDPAKPREFISHEAACLLNATDKDAHAETTETKVIQVVSASTLAVSGMQPTAFQKNLGQGVAPWRGQVTPPRNQ